MENVNGVVREVGNRDGLGRFSASGCLIVVVLLEMGFWCGLWSWIDLVIILCGRVWVLAFDFRSRGSLVLISGFIGVEDESQ